MKRWTTINREVRKRMEEDEFNGFILPFREAIREAIQEGKGENVGVKRAYREIRARMLENVRVNLALLDAAACEEEKLIKK